jgi:hypothetical protein
MLADSAAGRPGAHADRGMNARPALSEARDQRILRAPGPDVRNPSRTCGVHRSIL